MRLLLGQISCTALLEKNEFCFQLFVEVNSYARVSFSDNMKNRRKKRSMKTAEEVKKNSRRQEEGRRKEENKRRAEVIIVT